MANRGCLVVLALASGCAFDTTGSLPGAGPDAGIEPDPDAAVLGKFGEPALIGELSFLASVSDDPSLTGDLLEIYFNSNRLGGVGGDDIWRATRQTPDDLFSTPTVVTELSSTQRDTDPDVTPDGLAILFSSTRPGGLGGQDVWLSTRSSRNRPWSTPVLVPALNSPSVDAGTPNSASMDRIILSSDRPGGVGAFDLYESSKDGATWTAPTAIEGLVTPFNETDPFLTGDGEQLWFDSDRPGDAGGQDLWLATRPSLDEPFGPAEPLSELNSTGRDIDPWLSPDRRVIVFSSDRSGLLEYYIARR